jgi:hypothetical protein
MLATKSDIYYFYEQQIPEIDTIAEEMGFLRTISNAYMCDYLSHDEFEELDYKLNKCSKIALREGAIA